MLFISDEWSDLDITDVETAEKKYGNTSTNPILIVDNRLRNESD